MTNEQMIRELRAVAKKYEGKHVFTFETNIHLMATDAANHIEGLCEEINRQKAEIERLSGIIESYALQYGTATDRELFLSNARTKAVKEFAERLKKDRYVIFNTMYSDFWFSEAIDNLVKEFDVYKGETND